MAKFCPDCGSKLEEEYKFCPECGFNLSKKEDQNGENGSVKPDSNVEKDNSLPKLICENCGEENDPENFVCSGCGVKLKDKKSVSNSASKEEKKKSYQNTKSKPQSKKKHSRNTNYKNVKNSTQTDNKRKLNNAKIITIVSIGFGVAVIILIFSGVFDSLINPAPQPTVNQNTNSGINLNNVQQINNLEAKVKQNPKDTASILELAHLKNDSGLYEQAIVNYKQYLALVPGDPDARIDMGICYYNLQNYDTAIKEMELALKYDPKHQIGYLDLGIVNLTAGNFDKSKEWLKKAVELDPNSTYGKKAEELLKSHENANQTNGGK